MFIQPRKHRRIPFEDSTIVKMMETTNAAEMEDGESILCSTVDLSAGGVRLRVSRELPLGSRMEVWVKSKEQEGTLRIVGNVVWCRTLEGCSDLQAGLEILDQERTDYAEYRKRVDKLFKPG